MKKTAKLLKLLYHEYRVDRNENIEQYRNSGMSFDWKRGSKFMMPQSIITDFANDKSSCFLYMVIAHKVATNRGIFFTTCHLPTLQHRVGLSTKRFNQCLYNLTKNGYIKVLHISLEYHTAVIVLCKEFSLMVGKWESKDEMQEKLENYISSIKEELIPKYKKIFET